MTSSRSIELEERQVVRLKGFARVAEKIAFNPDKTTTIYRRFDRLSARNLLFLQAELAELEHSLAKHDLEDSRRNPLSFETQSDWAQFAQNAAQKDNDGHPASPREKEKMDLAMRIRTKLKEYHETLALHKDLLNTTPPSSSTVKALHSWFFNNTTGKPGGEKVPQLWGASETIFDDLHDLVALRVPADQDRLSEFIQNNFGVFFQTSAPDGRTMYTSERSISRFVAILSTILAAVLLFGAIISLYIVQNKHALLGMLSGWTVLFAACVGLLTNARRDQIFGATAAYAAVLVVFISGNLRGAPSTTGSCICTPG